jgi:hypothetical protein
MNLKDITLPAFLWYVLPGVNAIFFLLVLPTVTLDFEFLSKSMSWTSVLGYLTAALVIGFLMDSMKLYKFTWGYSRAKRAFYLQLASAARGNLAPVPDTTANERLGKSIFRLVRFSMGKEGTIFPLWEHSRWVMANHSSKLAYASSAMWAYLLLRVQGREVLLLGRYTLSPLESRVLVVAFAVAFLMIGLRLSRESWRVLEDSNNMYVDYVLASEPALAEKLKLVCAGTDRPEAESAATEPAGGEGPNVAG